MVGRGSGGGGKQGLLPSLSRQVLSVSSWFRIPEQGMKVFELLSRGTAFCIQLPSPPPTTQSAPAASISSSSRRRRVIVTCSHVVAPYRWTEHFREPWLEYVKDAHIECRLQLWRDSGIGLSEERRVRAPLHFHPTLDLCAFAYTEDEGDDAIIGGTDPLPCRDVESLTEALQEGEPLAFLGFPISNPESPAATTASQAATASPTLDVQSFRHVKGRALAPHVMDKEGRRYVRTEERLAVGMSGGPVLDSHGLCVGLFQGILPPPRKSRGGERGDGGAGEDRANEEEIAAVLRPLQAEAWELHAAFVPMAPILKFVKERGLVAMASGAADAAAAAAK